MVVLLVNESTKIAICGKLRSGKTTAAIHLHAMHGFETASFGGVLRLYAEQLFAYSDVYKSVPITKPDPFGGTMTIGHRKPRRLLQDFGQAMRKLDENIWINHVEERIKDIEREALLADRPARVVIDDLRQPDEYEWAKANGFVIVRINAPDELRIERAKAAGDDFSEEDLTHETEQYVDGFVVDFEIDNEGDTAELERKIDEILANLLA